MLGASAVVCPLIVTDADAVVVGATAADGLLLHPADSAAAAITGETIENRTSGKSCC